MKVILTTDIPRTGNKYDIKEFKDGYANILIAKGQAMMATPQALKNLENKKEEDRQKKQKEKEIFNSLVKNLNNKKITLKAKANEKGHLFKSIHPSDVAKVIQDDFQLEIEENAIIIPNIKELGVFVAEIKKGEISGSCEVVIEKE